MKNSKKKAQSLIEYGLILALVAIIALTVLSKFGKTITNVGDNTSDQVESVSTNAMTKYCDSLEAGGNAQAAADCRTNLPPAN